MQTEPNGAPPPAYIPATWEKIVTYLAAGIMLLVCSILLLFGRPLADPNYAYVIRGFLSMMGLIFATTGIGLLRVGWTWKGWTLRATAAFALAVLFWIFSPKVLSAPPPAVSMTVGHYKGATQTRLGDIGTSSQAARFGDSARVEVRASVPACCFLIAFDPDGKEELCWPCDAEGNGDPAKLPPGVLEFVYTPDPNYAFRLTDGAGLQAFVLVASWKPLPAYKAWKTKAPFAWTKADSDQSWTYDGLSFSGTHMGAGPTSGVPEPFRDICIKAKETPGIDAVRGVAFPVLQALADQKPNK